MHRLREAIRQKCTELWKNVSHIEFLAENKTIIMPQLPNSADLSPTDIFPLPKNTDERKAFCYAGGDKRKIETEAVGDSKKGMSEVF